MTSFGENVQKPQFFPLNPRIKAIGGSGVMFASEAYLKVISPFNHFVWPRGIKVTDRPVESNGLELQ